MKSNSTLRSPDAPRLAHVGPWVGPAVGGRVDALALKERVLDEAVDAVEGGALMVNDTGLFAYGLMMIPGTRKLKPLASTLGGSTRS